MKCSITRKTTFNAAHRLFLDELDNDANFELFGKCSYPNYHGHNYTLFVKIIGEINPKTGFVYDIAKLKSVIKEEVEEPFDHKNLNLDTSEFAQLIPTVENIAKIIYQKLRNRIEVEFDIRVKLYETERNIAEYPEL
jgi:6-pyruvoyltetrahydropterin/6-carboxytetrahydropterin synthase